MTVLYPINGAFTMYICRFVDPSFGFACCWEYAISWLTVLPFEISAACNIIHYWPGSNGINNAAWITPLLVALVCIQFFGVRGYGEVRFTQCYLKQSANQPGRIRSQLNEGHRLHRLHNPWNNHRLWWRSNRQQRLYWCKILVISLWDWLPVRLMFKQAFTVHCIPQWLPRLLQRLCHCGLRLYWHGADWTGCRGNRQPKKGDSQGLEPGRMAYRYLLHREPFPCWLDRTREQCTV